MNPSKSVRYQREDHRYNVQIFHPFAQLHFEPRMALFFDLRVRATFSRTLVSLLQRVHKPILKAQFRNAINSLPHY